MEAPARLLRLLGTFRIILLRNRRYHQGHALMSKLRAFVLVVVLLTVGFSFSLHASIDMFLDIAGIPGESKDSVHEGQVDVLAWNWGLSNHGPTNGVVGVAKANFQDLNVIKYVDKSSPLLMLNCANSGHITTATLYVQTQGTTPVEFIKIIMTDVLVTSVSTSGSDGVDRLTENVSLNFAKVELDYTPLNLNGSVSSTISLDWNIPDNYGSVISPVIGLAATLIYTNGASFAKLTWNSTSGGNYQVWIASDLNAAFQPYGEPTASTGDGTTSVIVPADAIRKFFRIETISSQ
jgi:type VI secretion system secreted protein Hcp